jgi:hypothetical protein
MFKRLHGVIGEKKMIGNTQDAHAALPHGLASNPWMNILT